MRVPLKQLAKDLLLAVAPRRTTALLSARSRAHSQRLVKAWGCVSINDKLVARLGSVVQEGPFRGMILSPMTHAEHLGPFLLGVYESELDPAWDRVLRGSYSQIVDVGSKFGYYAVGLARRFPDTQVVAFDTDAWARAATLEMASANRTSNVTVLGFCDTSWLRTQLRSGAFVISDCEGYEETLFATEPIPHLSSATLIIETHDKANPGVTDRIRARLGATHEIHEFADGSPRRDTTCDLRFLSEDERSRAPHEIRGPQIWLWCTPRRERDRSASAADHAR